MGARAEAFAKEFEAKVDEATATLENLSDADWKKTTAAEKWTVAATAHHVASSYEVITRIIRTIAAGQPLPHFTRQMLDEMNAEHARTFAGCAKPETLALHKSGAAAAAPVVIAQRYWLPKGSCGTPAAAKMKSREASSCRRRLRRSTSSRRPFHFRTLPATITVSTFVRSISDTTAPGTLLTGATLIDWASRMMMSASLPGVSVPVLLSSPRALAPLIVA